MTQRQADQRKGLGVLLLLFAGTALMAIGFPTRARLFPLLVGLAGVALVVAEIGVMRRRGIEATSVDDGSLVAAFIGILPYLAWLVAFFAVAALVGFVLGAGIFVGAFLRREAESSWLRSLGGTLGTIAFLALVGNLFGLHWPVSLWDPLRTLGIL